MIIADNIFLRIAVFQVSTILFFNTHCFSQCRSVKDMWNSILAIENVSSANAAKLQQAYRLKHEFDQCNLNRDSVYARLLHRIATLEFLENDNKATRESVEYLLHSIAINNSDAPGSSPGYAVNSYYNLAVFYSSLDLNNKALDYYDSVIITDKKLNLHRGIAIECRVPRADIFFKNGDFQKCVDECIAGLTAAKRAGGTITMMQLFNRRAQSYVYLGKLEHAGADTDSALHYARMLGDDFERATAAKIKALICARDRQLDKAVLLFNKAIHARKKTNEYAQVADDYTDLGNFYFQHLKQYKQAQGCYFKTVEFAKKASDAQRMCKGYINLGEVAFRLQQDDNYISTENYYRKALAVYGLNQDSFLQDPPLSRLAAIGNTDLLLVILHNKTELLLRLYKSNGNKRYLNACLSTAVLMDSAIAQARHEQLGEQSKLYWRNKTRSFYAIALEACYVANDMPKAFFFMEKSRAVLLSDKLNELGAATHLPALENTLEQNYKATIVYEQQKLNRVNKASQAYQAQQLKVVQAKEALEHYVRTLEHKYPAYYQYKYADDIPSLGELQTWLQQRKESFVHYFIQDTAAYILVTTPHSSRMIKLRTEAFDVGDINLFLQWCSGRQQLNSHFLSFAALAHKLYTSLFEPLQLPGGRVVLCQDNFLLPFEALCEDRKGNRFLVYDYVFSYVYSARYLMKSLHVRRSRGDFVGFAPVSFAKDLGVPELRHSAASLAKAAAYYAHAKLFTQTAATRRNFIEQLADYSIVNIFSHALADTGNREPVLYMQDTVINLSELQLLSHPATQLIMLSACQTNVGKNATGEGIYSLARGFSLAGIPSVSATLWKADEETIYAISNAFHALLSKGMRKDEALQKAKLLFMESGGKENLLPYYWANMIIIGSTDAVVLSSTAPYRWWVNAGIIFATVTAVIVLLVRARRRNK